MSKLLLLSFLLSLPFYNFAQKQSKTVEIPLKHWQKVNLDEVKVFHVETELIKNKDYHLNLEENKLYVVFMKDNFLFQKDDYLRIEYHTRPFRNPSTSGKKTQTWLEYDQ